MTDNSPDSNALDGNAALGAFSAVFGTELSTVMVTCAGCSASAMFAEQRAFLSGRGAILRCPGCDHLLARVVETRSEVWLEMSGSSSWRFALPGSND